MNLNLKRFIQKPETTTTRNLYGQIQISHGFSEITKSSIFVIFAMYLNYSTTHVPNTFLYIKSCLFKMFTYRMHKRVICKITNCGQKLFSGQTESNFSLVTDQIFSSPEYVFYGHPLSTMYST